MMVSPTTLTQAHGPAVINLMLTMSLLLNVVLACCLWLVVEMVYKFAKSQGMN